MLVYCLCVVNFGRDRTSGLILWIIFGYVSYIGLMSIDFRLELAYARNHRLDGIPGSHATFEFWDTLQARAKIKTGGAGGVDGNSADIFQ